MSLEALKPSAAGDFRHRPGHDLESLLHTMLIICTYTNGPGGNLREYVKPDDDDDGIKLDEWFGASSRKKLVEAKTFTLEAFNSFIQPHLPDYWQDFGPFLERLINATWDQQRLYEANNIATHEVYRVILKDALVKYNAEEKKELSVYAAYPKPKRTINNIALRQSKRLRTGNDEHQATESVELLPRRIQSEFLEDYAESVERPLLPFSSGWDDSEQMD